jgi:hypothetical protein
MPLALPAASNGDTAAATLPNAALEIVARCCSTCWRGATHRQGERRSMDWKPDVRSQRFSARLSSDIARVGRAASEFGGERGGIQYPE